MQIYNFFLKKNGPACRLSDSDGPFCAVLRHAYLTTLAVLTVPSVKVVT